MLDRLLLFAAAADPLGNAGLPPRQGVSNLFGLGIRDLSLILASAAILALVLFLWVYLSRRERRRHLSRTGRVIARADRQARREDTEERRRRIRKRRPDHPDNLPRNPTLGETGGLPPIRPDEPAQPA